MGPGNTVLEEDLKRQREVENLNRDAIEWREQGGKYLRGLRNQKGMSQRELAAKVGFAYYTKISAIENDKEIDLDPSNFGLLKSMIESIPNR